MDLAKLDRSPQTVTITEFVGPADIIERLKEMGLHLGVSVLYQGRAPFRGPHLIRFGSTVVALRDEEAACGIIRIG